MEKINKQNNGPGKFNNQAYREVINFSAGGKENHWRWVCIGVIGNENTNSTIGIFQISGAGHVRNVTLHEIREIGTSVTPEQFAESISQAVTSGDYPECLIAIDGDGLGAPTAAILSKAYGLVVQQIHWARRPAVALSSTRYLNQRAYAHFVSKRALEDGRLQLPPVQSASEQASHISHGINSDGQLFVVPKKDMTMPVGHWDVCCFAQLVDIHD